MQPSAVVVPPDPEAVSARAEGCSADIVAGKTKSTVIDRATPGCCAPGILDRVTHACLLWCLRRKRCSVAIGGHFVTRNWIVDSTETKSIGQPSQSYVGEGPT